MEINKHIRSIGRVLVVIVFVAIIDILIIMAVGTDCERYSTVSVFFANLNSACFCQEYDTATPGRIV